MHELKNDVKFAGGLAAGALGHSVGFTTNKAWDNNNSLAVQTTRRNFRCQTPE
jgi:hypothetical protein